jgi:polysaccharide biosynthesis PFTS motif protein
MKVLLNLEYLLNKKKRIRSSIRGLKYLRDFDKLGFWEDLRFQLLKTPPIEGKYLSKFFFGSSHKYAETAVHQYCIEKIIKLWLGKQILIQCSNPKYEIIWPSPPKWINIFKENGLKINEFISSALWGLLILFIFIFNLISILLLLYKIAPCVLSKSINKKKFYFFSNLTFLNIPKFTENKSYDVISWFIDSKFVHQQIGRIVHTVKNVNNCVVKGVEIEAGRRPYEVSIGVFGYLQFCSWLICALCICLIDLIMLRWIHPLMFLEAARLKVINLAGDDKIAAGYFFHWSSGVYRPLWTYEATRRGADVSLYYYSLIEHPSIKNRPYSHYCAYGLLNWPHYICWNKRQANLIKENSIGSPKISIVGPIWFSESAEFNNNNNLGDYVAIFCLEYFRKSFYIGVSSLTDYFEENPFLSELFLKDVEFCCEKTVVNMAHKRKRNEGRRGKKGYAKLIQDLEKNKIYKKIDTKESTISLIKEAKGVVCFPFTSVALQAQSMGKPVVYYDPVSWIDPNDDAANGIKIIQGRDELLKWFHSFS